ncbi:DUF1801 domain-containing protein [Rhodalgimonas zhirmunskyi]|uniref:DUF1801 domain-containing protein n=1 Tax=Rhodalgimonas zhirmunskyi TaxID=2964767 RepID=A0AAJ1UBB1_9RHOB|nr:DUF1801 domain-containing protein [Rhodoalgimonas zhirmunskyi]MDQ2094518.1 DUF1801 domain-containing protein [Rhodoalgimonas zhirmunskyi]
MTPEVAAVFDSFPTSAQDILFGIRRLIFEIANGSPDIGPLKEALRWGQPAYLTPSGAGSTIRLGMTKTGEPALFVHCRTSLIEDFRPLAPKSMRFEGRRAVLFEEKSRPDKESLALLIRAALSYHRRSERVAG